MSAARFFAASSAQLDDSFSDLTDFLSPGLAAVAVPGAAVPGFAVGLWMVPLISPGFFSSSGFLATSTLRGALIMARIAAASAR